MTLQTGN